MFRTSVRSTPQPGGSSLRRFVLVSCLLALPCSTAVAGEASRRAPTDIVLLSTSGARPQVDSRGVLNLDIGVARRAALGRTWSELPGSTVEVSIAVDRRVVRVERVSLGAVADLEGVRDQAGAFRGRCSRGHVSLALPELAGARGATVDLRLAGSDSTLPARRRVVLGSSSRFASTRVGTPTAAYAAAGCTATVPDDVRAAYGVTVAQAMHPDGWPRVAYYAFNEDFDYDLGYATQSAGGWTIESADSSATTDIGDNCDMGIDASGVVSLSYWDYDNANLRYARRATTGAWTRQTVTSTQEVGEYNSLALDPAGLPRIAFSYVNSSTFVSQLRLASRSAGGSWSASEVVDNSADVGYYCSMAIDGSNRVHVAYYDWDNGILKYAVRNGTTWTVEVADDSELDQGESASLALDAAGNPCVAYLGGADGHLMLARRSLGGWTHEDVDLTTIPGESISLAIGADGRAAIAYVDAGDGRVLLARQQPSGGWTVTQATDPGTAAGPVNLMATAGGTRIAYLDESNNSTSVRYLTCIATLDAPAPGSADTHGELRVGPVPMRGSALQIQFADRAGDDRVRGLRILDVAGRTLKHFDSAALAFGGGHVTWDGLDDRGVRVRPGAYFVEARTDSGRILRRITVLQ